jgi:23S rRNA pseudouridine1911/1915/1917 synthase
MSNQGTDAPHVVTVSAEMAGARLDKALAFYLSDISRSRIQALIEEGFVVDERGATCQVPTHKVKVDDTYHVTMKPAEDATITPEAMDLEIIHEDDDLLVLNKPADLVVHPGSGNAQGTLVNALLAHCGDSLSGIGGVKRPGIVHRLDKGTSGLMVVAKTDHAHQALSEQFATRSLSRTYWAFVMGKTLSEDFIDMPLGRSTLNRQKMTVRKEGGKEAQTTYQTLEYFGTNAIVASLIECQLKTGRTHQIRVHLSHSGFPLIGDPVYGRARSNPMLKRLWTLPENQWADDRQALHAKAIKFVHPVTRKKMYFEAELPSDLKALHATLKNA